MAKVIKERAKEVQEKDSRSGEKLKEAKLGKEMINVNGESLEEQIKRLSKLAEYIEGYNNATKARDKNDFKELIEYILQPGETIENYSKIIEEYKKAYEVRKAHIDKLKTEIKKIRQIKVDDWI